MAEIPDKSFYKVQEVCQYTDTQPYVLRFWESEFPQLAPQKGKAGQRVYTRKEVNLILRIKKLLYEEEYTIAGARQRLEDETEVQKIPDGRRMPDGRQTPVSFLPDDAVSTPPPRSAAASNETSPGLFDALHAGKAGMDHETAQMRATDGTVDTDPDAGDGDLHGERAGLLELRTALETSRHELSETRTLLERERQAVREARTRLEALTAEANTLKASLDAAQRARRTERDRAERVASKLDTVLESLVAHLPREDAGKS